MLPPASSGTLEVPVNASCCATTALTGAGVATGTGASSGGRRAARTTAGGLHTSAETLIT